MIDASKLVTMSNIKHSETFLHVLQNDDEVEPYTQKYMEIFKRLNLNRNQKLVNKRTLSYFILRFKDHVFLKNKSNSISKKLR